ncbi:helix-turn-helix transcriptional regulator [Streptomyces olivoreticuli]
MPFRATITHPAQPGTDLGTLIRSRRNGRQPRMTQAALGTAVRYSGPWVRRVEAGDLIPLWRTLAQIGDVLEITADELMNAAHPVRRDEVRDTGSRGCSTCSTGHDRAGSGHRRGESASCSGGCHLGRSGGCQAWLCAGTGA